MRCPCVSCRAECDRRYVRRIDSGWPRWLAFLASPPASDNYDKAEASLALYERALAEGRIGVGFLGSVVCPDREIATEITRTFGMRK